MLHIREISPSRTALREFIRFPLTLYKEDPNYIIPSVEQQVGDLLGRHNALMTNGVQAFLMAYDGEEPVGRLVAGIDYRAAQQPGERQGYIGMFECVNNQNVANALFDAAETFFKENGISAMVGPNPPLFNDFGTGILLQGFDLEPTFLSPYNPSYYAELFESAGFAKLRDYFSYDLPLEGIRDDRYESVLRRAGKRFGYRIETVNLKRDLKHRVREFSRVISESTPPEWGVVPPTAEALYRELKRIRNILWQDYILVAYAGERPVGLLLVIPDINPMLKGLKGNMFPVGTFRTLFMRSYIKRLRTVMLYVVPEFQNKGVEAVMIYQALDTARMNGIKQAEATMVNEQNLKLQVGVEKLGGTISKVYRQYQKEIK